MRDSSTRSFSAVGSRMQYERDRHRKKKRLITAAILIITVLIVFFSVLILGEIFHWFGPKAPGEDSSHIHVNFDSEKLVSSEDVHKGDLILINASFPYTFPEVSDTYLPLYENRNKHSYTNATGELKTVYAYYTQTAKSCAKLESNTLKALNAMADDFFKATNNIDLFVYDQDGYRTYEEQAERYNKNPLKYAPAGQTEHHTGKCVDLYVYTMDKVFANLDDPAFASIYRWIYDNAYRYGFTLRYPSAKVSTTGVNYEPYHFRYIGYAHAFYMQQNNLCLEEYLDLLRDNHTFDKKLEIRGDDGFDYLVYYVPKAADSMTTLKVPSEAEGVSYEISGDNKEGFIVTVKVAKISQE